jgi:hypothetical protein
MRLTARRRVPIVLCGLGLAAAAWDQIPAALDHPTWKQRAQSLNVSPADGYRFVVFGDQKNLWDEFSLILRSVAALAGAEGPPLLFMVDTGDIVDQGNRISQFEFLKDRLLNKYVPELPYLVAVGTTRRESARPGFCSWTPTIGSIARGRRKHS